MIAFDYFTSWTFLSGFYVKIENAELLFVMVGISISF